MNLVLMREEHFLRRCAGFIERFGLQRPVRAQRLRVRIVPPLQPRWNARPDRDVAGHGADHFHWVGPVKSWDGIRVAHQNEWRAAVATIRERRGAPTE